MTAHYGICSMSWIQREERDWIAGPSLDNMAKGRTAASRQGSVVYRTAEKRAAAERKGHKKVATCVCV